MTQPDNEPSAAPLTPGTKAVIISSAMFVFISYWRVAAIILCDLASTAYYIGGIVEHSIGPAAPWFIVGVMLFSYAVRSVYIESCSMYVRGGVYRIVKESLGRTWAKLAVSALLFDYVLTGPISGVSAGQYIMGLFFELLSHTAGTHLSPESRDWWKAVGSVVIASSITIYFFRVNVVGIHESSDKALKIMIATTIMGVIILAWSILTIVVRGVQNKITFQPTFEPKENPSTGVMESPLGFLEGTSFADYLLHLNGWDWLSAIGFLGFFLAFGHSVLAMSGEETLAQIYREVESPKLKNFKRAAFIVFIFSLLLTGGISVLAVLLIPDNVRMSHYSDNLIGGLAMHVVGPPVVRLLLNIFVVVIGSLILAGAVNTAIIGSNGVLNRVAEDGVIPEWLLKPHPRFGTTYRMLFLIFVLQMVTILISRGDVLLLGEAYAFGVVWSFVFNCLAMLVLRFRDPDRPRGYKVPLNIRVRGVEIPIGMGLILVVLLISAIMNVLTKEIATIAGTCFTVVLFLLFLGTETYQKKQSGGAEAEHLDDFNQVETESITAESLGLKHRFRKLVAIRSPKSMDALDKVLEETDPETTDIVALKAQSRHEVESGPDPIHLDLYERELVNAIVKRAETAGKTIVPIVVSTNNPVHAMLQTALALGVHEVIVGTSERFTPDQQLNMISRGWQHLHGPELSPLTVRIIGGNRDITVDMAGGNRVPAVARRDARSVREMRAAGIGVDRVLILHDGSQRSSDLFRSLLTMLDIHVSLEAIQVEGAAESTLTKDIKEAERLGYRARSIKPTQSTDFVANLIQTIRNDGIDVVVARKSLASFTTPTGEKVSSWIDEVVHHTRSQVFVAAEFVEPISENTTGTSG